MSRNLIFSFFVLVFTCKNIGHQSPDQSVSILLFVSCSTSVTCSASIYWKYNILLKQWRRCFTFMYLFNGLDWDPTATWVNQMQTMWRMCKDVKWIKSASLNMHNYYLLSWGVSKKTLLCWFYWSAQTIRVVSQIYREQNNRGDVSQSENTDVTITYKLIGQYWFFICNWFVFSCDLEWQREVPSN